MPEPTDSHEPSRIAARMACPPEPVLEGPGHPSLIEAKTGQKVSPDMFSAALRVRAAMERAET